MRDQPTDPARGALVVVYRSRGDELLYLLLRRAGATSGDWAWGPPAGEREPGEDADGCAARELREETGLEPTVARADSGSPAWPVYLARVETEAVRLSAEHDRCVWLPLGEAAARTAPAAVRAGLLRAAASIGDPLARGAEPPPRVLGTEDDAPLVPAPNEVSLVLSSRLPPVERVTAVLGLVFDGDRLLMTRLRAADRDWDVPGGHVEPGETPEEALRREVYEEAGVRLGRARVFAHQAIRLLGPAPPGYRHPWPDSYMVFYRAAAAAVDRFEPTEECAERAFLPPGAVRETLWFRRDRGLYDAALADASTRSNQVATSAVREDPERRRPLSGRAARGRSGDR